MRRSVFNPFSWGARGSAEETRRKPGRPRIADRIGDYSDLVDESRTYWAELRRDWEDLLDYYRDDEKQQSELLAGLKATLDGDEDLAKAAAVVSNHIYSMVETFAGTISQLPAAPVVVSPTREVDDYSQRITSYLSAFSVKRNICNARMHRCRQAIVIGTGTMKVFWDPRINDVRIAPISPMAVYPDPYTPDCTEPGEASFIAIRNIYSGRTMRRLFDGSNGGPKFDETKAEAVLGADEDAVETTEQDLSDGYVLWELYHEFGERLALYSGEQLYYDDDNPTPGGIYPVFFYPMAQWYGDFWGHSVLSHLVGLQSYINRTRSRILLREMYATGPLMHGTDPQPKIDLKPGGYTEHHPDTQIEWWQPPGADPSVFTSLAKAQADFDAISGVFDITRGKREKGIQSGAALTALATQNEQRLVAPVEPWAYTEARMWQCVMDLMRDNYLEDRTLSMMQGGEAVSVGITPADLARAQYHVIMQAEQELPLTPLALADLASRALQLGAIDVLDWLDMVKFPNREAIKQRIMGQREARLQGQQAAQEMLSQGRLAEQGQAPISLPGEILGGIPPQYASGAY